MELKPYVSWSEVAARVSIMGATHRGGISWDWAVGIHSQEEARLFVQWLESKGLEHRGVYPGDNNTWDVRFR